MDIPGDGLDADATAAVRGDRAALARVLEAIRPIVVRYCRARVGASHRRYGSADDVAQEVCLAVITALPRPGRPFLAFVYGIASHKVADARRSAARNRADLVAEVPEAEAETDGPEQRALDAEAAARMASLLDTLPERQREILVLRLVVGMSAEETAAAVGGTAGAVRVAQHRGLTKLKETLAAEAANAGEAT